MKVACLPGVKVLELLGVCRSGNIFIGAWSMSVWEYYWVWECYCVGKCDKLPLVLICEYCTVDGVSVFAGSAFDIKLVRKSIVVETCDMSVMLLYYILVEIAFVHVTNVSHTIVIIIIHVQINFRSTHVCIGFT